MKFPSSIKAPGPVEDALGSLRTADGLFCVDRNQRIVYWSSSAEKVIGMSADEVVGRPCYEVLGAGQPLTHPRCQPNCQVLANAIRGRPTRDFDVRISLEEQDKWLNVSIVLAEDGDERSPLMIHLARDVTERRNVDFLTAAAAVDGAAVEEEESPGHRNLSPLSRRERQVVQLLAHGYRASAVAEALGLSPVTVRNHITRAMSKLGVHSRLEAVIQAAKSGLI